MDKTTLDTLATVLSATLESFLAAHEETQVHNVSLTYRPATALAEAYCVLEVTQTVRVIQQGEVQEPPPLPDPEEAEPIVMRYGPPFTDEEVEAAPAIPDSLGAIVLAEQPLALSSLADLEAHIAESESRSRQGFPPLTDEARRARQAAADELLARESQDKE